MDLLSWYTLQPGDKVFVTQIHGMPESTILTVLDKNYVFQTVKFGYYEVDEDWYNPSRIYGRKVGKAFRLGFYIRHLYEKAWSWLIKCC